MGGCRCSFKTCRSATKTAEGLHFFHYPVKHRERCAIWIRNAEKGEFMNLPDDQLRNKVICGLHFEDKYFTNVQRKRLVHDAIPVLNGGCSEVQFEKDIEIYPTSMDGSTFTLHTENFQPGPSRSNLQIENLEAKFTFAAGDLIKPYPVIDESEVYTIDPSYIQDSFHNPGNGKDIFLHPNEEYQTDVTESIVYKTSSNKIEPEEFIEHNIYDNEDYLIPNVESSYFEPPQLQSKPDKQKVTDLDAQIIEDFEEDEDAPIELPKPKPNNDIVGRKILKRIHAHSQEIANIKKSLLKTKRILTTKSILTSLRGKIPPTLFGALSLHLNKKSGNFSAHERAFMTSLFSISPCAYNDLKHNRGWGLPEENVVQGLIKEDF